MDTRRPVGLAASTSVWPWCQTLLTASRRVSSIVGVEVLDSWPLRLDKEQWPSAGDCNSVGENKKAGPSGFPPTSINGVPDDSGKRMDFPPDVINPGALSVPLRATLAGG
ncbi:hypothetical protein AOLI_G00282610 [Acnodon oligacanthus]